MFRAMLALAGGVLLCAGCSRIADGQQDDRGQGVPASPSPIAEPAEQPREVKTALVRSLLKRLDQMQLSPEEEEVRDELRQTLLDADEELSYALGDGSKQLVLESNQKAPVLRRSGRRARSPRLITPPPALPHAAPADREPKTPLVRALIDTLPAIGEDGEESRDALREHLLDADRELSQVLGKNSKRLIEQANRKVQIRVVPDGPARPQPRLRTPPPS